MKGKFNLKSEIKIKNKNINRFRNIVLVVFFILLTIFSYLTFNEITCAFKKEGIEKTIIIPERSSIGKISKILANEKIISSQMLFQVYSRFKDYKNIKSGKFKLKTNTKYDKIMKIITNQENVVYDEKIIIFEGLNFFTLKEKYSGKLNINIEEIINEINNEENYEEFLFIKELKEENLKNAYFKMEGFVMPYTFPIKENSTAKSIAKEILKKSNEKFLNLREDIKKSNMNIWEILTLASIIQAETSNEKEMKRVSSVFHNRLKIKKRLESDVTTLYAKKIEKDMKEKGLTVNKNIVDGYDTYKISGLPKGPICTPSMSAIEAAINPSDENFYYFYADPKTGKIYYEKDFESHRKNYKKD